MNKLYFALLCLVLSCQSSKAPTSDKTDIIDSNETNEILEVEQVAEEYFSDRYALEENFDGSYTIIKSKFKNIRDLLPDVYFMLYDNNSNVIVHSDTLKAGYVGWDGRYVIKTIERLPAETPNSSTEFNVYYYNAIDQEFVDRP